MTPALRIVEGAEAARSSVLRRDRYGGWLDPPLPDAVRVSIRETFGEDLGAAQVVARIIEDVRSQGDDAVTRYSQRFDRSTYTTLEVSREEIDSAFAEVPTDLLAALELAADRVRSYHALQADHGPRSFVHAGIGMIVRPLERVGIYMPGAGTSLPSTVIHTAVPGAVAEVGEIVGVTSARADGSIEPLKLVAAQLSGVGRLFRASGAQAIAALAFGTETIPRVDKVFGPGNVFVTLAKQQLYGVVGIDALNGPTETLVLADESAEANLCAADLLAQAEHDELATPVLITTSRRLADAVAAEVDLQLSDLERGAVARAAIERGGAVVAADMDEAIDLANEFAPEHLCLLTDNPELLVERIRHAGGVFVGERSPEALGDYVAGPSHVMPTGGSARYASPLTVFDFLKMISIVDVQEDELSDIGEQAALLARAEGLTGHARSIEARLEGR